VLSGLQALDPADYMSALEQLAEQFEKGALDKSIMDEAMHPRGRMVAFLEDNYTHPRVVAFLNKVKAKIGNDESMANTKEYIDEILGGQAKTATDLYREDFEGMPEGDIPKIILPQ
jgi:hypothetical protein